MGSRNGLLLLVQPQGKQRGVSDLGDFEAHTGQISDGVSGTTETSDENLIVFVDETHATIAGHVASNSLVVLFELDSHALADGGVRLFGLNTDLLDNDAGSVGASAEGLAPSGSLMRFLVALVGPSNSGQIPVPYLLSLLFAWS